MRLILQTYCQIMDEHKRMHVGTFSKLISRFNNCKKNILANVI